MMKRISFAAIALLLCISTTLPLSAQQNLSEKIPIDNKVKVGKLANGLTYYIRQNSKPEKKVELRLVVNAGSILEDNDQQGLAHFTEHMAFNGTKNFKKNELVNFLQSIGVDFGADLNAYTSFDETVYILPIPLSDPNNFTKGLQILQDWAGGISFEGKQIDDERGIILEESRLGKGAEDRMFRKIYPKQYEGSKYAQRLPIGKDSLLKTFKHSAIKRFYTDWYRPNLMAVMVVGDIDVAATEKLINQYFGGLKNPANPRPRTYASIPARTKNDALVVTDKEATNFQIELNYSTVKTKPETTVEDYRKNSIIKSLFTSMLNQRMNELAQSGNPPFSFAGGNFGSYARGYEGFNGFAIPGPKGPDTALLAVLTEIERIKKFGFTQSELDRAKKQQLASIERSYNNRDKTESSVLIEEYIRNFLQQEPIPGIEREFEYKNSLMPGVQLAEVNALANELKKNDKVFVAVQGPEKSNFNLPSALQLIAVASNASSIPVKAYEEKAIANVLLKNIPTAGTLVKESKNEALDITELTYSNGTRVIIKNTNFKQDEIILTGFKKGGTNAYGVADKFSANYATAAIQQMGVGEFNPIDLRKFLSGKIANANVSLNALSARVSGNSSIKDMETMFQLMYLNFTQIRKDEALFNSWREKTKSQIQFMMADPTSAFIDSVYKVMYGGNPLAPSAIPNATDFDQINLERAIEIFKEQTNDANEFTFIMVGNIDINNVKPLLATYIGGLPSKGKTGKMVDNGVRILPGQKELKFYKGKEPKSFIFNIYSGDAAYSEAKALQVEMLSEIMNIKIIEELREKIGGIYGGGVGGSLNKYPYEGFTMVLQLPCGPENVEKLTIAANAEIEKIKQNGPEQKDLDKVKKSLLEKYAVNIKDNRYWSGVLQGIYFSNNDPNRFLNYTNIVNGISIEDIKNAANLVFENKNRINAVLFPEQ
ncbi:M16 family metallopeptidase [Sediminibacterium sp.]|uniref:M16 family metallopeptidase n=1 Tax=Sediminibacterium sp. TaxID=1917865 RepID=UPI003F6FFF3A